MKEYPSHFFDDSERRIRPVPFFRPPHPHHHHYHHLHHQYHADGYRGDSLVGQEPYGTIVFSTVGLGPTGPKGDKGDTGDPLIFDDLTREQLEEIAQMISITGLESLDGHFVTTAASTSDITIPISNFSEDDILVVDINGLTLIPEEEYTVEDGVMTLVTPIVHKGAVVHFHVTRVKTESE